MAESAVTGVILAGGASERMGGGAPKALAPLGRGTLLGHVRERLAPQCKALWLSVSHPAAFASLDLPAIPDAAPRRRGPLAGLQAALARLAAEDVSPWLLLAPCDAPFLPLDLVARLAAAAREQSTRVAAARHQGAMQPAFSLWHVETLAHVEALLDGPGNPGLKHAFNAIDVAVVDWPEATPPPFFNVNTPAELARAERWLDDGGAEEG